MYHTNRTVELELLASAIRRQERRFDKLILDLQGSRINRSTTAEELRQIENDLRRPPAQAAA